MECNKCVSIDTGRQKEIQISSRFSPAVFQADCPCCSSDVLHVELDAPRQPATRHLSLQFQAENTLVSYIYIYIYIYIYNIRLCLPEVDLGKVGESSKDAVQAADVYLF